MDTKKSRKGFSGKDLHPEENWGIVELSAEPTRVLHSERFLIMAGQMTLGDFHAELSSVDPSTIVRTENFEALGEAHSYRGYYEEIAFEPASPGTTVTAGELAQVVENAIGTVFTGWKGGDFRMDVDTPVWISSEGMNSGRQLVGVEVEDGIMTLLEEESAW